MEESAISETINRLVGFLKLKAHPEGGWYRENYTSDFMISPDRPSATSIYFLMSRSNFSAFHRLQSDEIWYYHDGDPLEVLIIHENGKLEKRVVGSSIEGCEPQTIVPAGSWFASRIHGKGSWSLAGCAVSPGFDFDDFELADRKQLVGLYPQHKELIHALTRV